MDTLLQYIRRIVYRPEFFVKQQFLQERYLRFYSKMILGFTLVVLVICLPSGIRVWRGIAQENWFGQRAVIERLFPSELQVHIDEDGTLSTNVQEPYAIALPQEWRSFGKNTPHNLLVIDTTTPVSQERFTELSTDIIVGKHEISQYDSEKHTLKSTGLQEVGKGGWSGTIDAATYSNLIARLFTILWRVALVITLLFPFVCYLFFWVAYLLYLLFGACLVWLVAKTQERTLGYRSAFVAGIYLLPVPLVYRLLTIGLPIFSVPIVFSVILVGVAVLNFRKSPPQLPEEMSEQKTVSADDTIAEVPEVSAGL